MALINSTGKYIKLSEGGAFEVYLNEEARLKAKTSTSFRTILKKYTEVLLDLQSSMYAEVRCYNSIEFDERFQSWQQEFQRYQYNLTHKVFDEEYPLMAEYYPDVADSIPKILFKGILGGIMGKNAETVEEAYLYAKQNKNWGETIDA